jgi:hypothetical protein
MIEIIVEIVFYETALRRKNFLQNTSCQPEVQGTEAEHNQ